MSRGRRSRGRWCLVLIGLLFVGVFSSLAPARAPAPPTVTLWQPIGGEYIAGGSTYSIRWEMFHENDTTLTVNISLSTDGGTTYPYIIGMGTYPTGVNNYSWIVPYYNTVTARIRICAYAMDGSNACTTSANFVIDSTLPYIVSVEPANGATGVPLFATIIIVFSEAMDQQTTTWFMTPFMPLDHSWSNDSQVLYIFPFPTGPGFQPCITYAIGIDGTDLAGNPLTGGPDPNPFSFTTDCGTSGAPTLVSPLGGEDWTGGSVHSIIWYQGSPPPSAWALAWTMNTTWTMIANGTSGNGTNAYPWTVPVVDTTTARVRVCGYQGLCDVSGTFTIDSTAPAVVSTVPANGTKDVPVTSDLQATFSEAMNTVSVERSFFIVPTTMILSFVWPAPTQVVIVPESLLPATTYVWGFNCAAHDASDPGNTLFDCQATHAFTTEAQTSITLLSPVGGESWTGGSPHPVSFRLSNGNPNTVRFVVDGVYRYANGTQSGTIGTMAVNVSAFSSQSAQFAWSAPTIDATDVVVNLTATGAGANATAWDESGPFEIDSTPPLVLSYRPVGPQAPIDPTVVVAFSEPLVVPSAPADVLTILPSVPIVLRWGPARDALDAILSGTQPCTSYAVTVGGNPSAPLRDDSDPGNPMPAFPWTFTTICAPTVDLLAPNGGEDWTGGSVHDIRWVSDDKDDATLTAALSYSLDGGITFPNAIATLTVAIGPGSFAWTVPKVDSLSVVVRITVTDAAGNIAADMSAAAFAIDSTPPAVLVSFPSDGGTGAKTTRDIWFVFTEAVDRASFQAAFSIAPNPGGLSFAWWPTDTAGDLLIVSHSPFKTKTTYVVTFATTAKDVSDPGNHPAAPLTVTFTTQPPSVNPPVAKAVGHHQVEVGVPETLDGSQSTGSIQQYVWRIMDNQDHFVGVLVGMTVTYTFRQNGRYHVTLAVTDANGASAEDTIEIAVTSSSSDGVIVGGAALFVAMAVAATTEAGRTLMFSWFVFPLYIRRRRNEVLEHQTRGMILGYILVHPGDTYTDIKRNLMLTNGTLSYHLTVLEREGLVRSTTRGPRKLFFSREARVPEDGGGMHEVQVRIYRALGAVPGLAVKDIAGALGITSQHALYHVRELAAQGYVRLERRGLALRCYAEPGKVPPLHEDSGGP